MKANRRRVVWLGFVCALGLLRVPVTAQVCPGDCNADYTIAINELIVCVNVSLGAVAVTTCAACDANGDGAVAINELITAVNASFGTCGPLGTPSPQPTATPVGTPGDRQCCVPAYYVWNCEDRSSEECTTLGGVDEGSGSCSPNPCADLPPADGHGICCLPNAAGDEIECEDRAASACVAAGGVVKSAGTVCAVETCADVLPPNPDVRCCLDGDECEDRSASACAAAGGINMGAGVCAPDTCSGVGGDEIQCCVPKQSGELVECEQRSAAQCANRGGTDRGAGDCDPDPCNPLTVD